MKIVGLILLILGIVLAVQVMKSAPIQGNEAYDVSKRIGRGSAPYILMAIGLRFLLRRDPQGRQAAPTRAAPTRLTQHQQPVAAPPVHPASMPVKIQCGCGQHYEFEVEPVAGRMPSRVACPACGVDGTDAANASITQTLALRAATPAWAPPAAPQRRFHPALLIGIGAVGAVVALIVTATLVRSLVFRNRAGTPPPPSFRSETDRRNPPPLPRASTRITKSPPPKSGSLRDAAPVPADMTTVDAFWGGRWYEATILRRDGPRAFIHYEGWSSSYDEWVTPDRLRPRR